MHRVLRVLPALLLATAASAEHYRFRHFGHDDGLNTAVSRLLQDRTGFLWVGTGDGLFRYDGARFQRFGTEDGLPSASVRGLHQAADGTLWVVTGRGLARLRQNSFEAVETSTGHGDRDLHAIDSAGSGELYIGSDRGLLAAEVSPGGTPRFHLVPGASAEPVNGVYAEENGAVWFGCGLRLCLLEGGRVRVLGEPEGLPRERWSAMLRDRHGDLWVRGTQHMHVLPAGAARFQARDQGLPQASNTLMAIAMDREGTLLVSTDLGLARWIDGRWDLITTAQGLESDTVTSVLQDREGSLWIGLWGAGIARWPGYGEWTAWTTADGLSNNVVWATRRDRSGALWIGTDRGISRMQPGSPLRTWTKAEGLGGDKVKAIVLGPDGAIWAGCLPGGVSRIDPVTGRIRVYGPPSGLADDRVIALHIDDESRLWASTGEGLYRSTTLGPRLRFERQRPPGSGGRTMFFRFLRDRRRRLWVGSSDGLYRWDQGEWARFTTNDGLASDAVTHLAQTDDGAIWAAYREPFGVSRLTLTTGGIQVRHFLKKDGLPSNYILFLGLDARRRLWVGTDYGVAVEAAAGWTTYTHEDGLVWDDCAANSFLADADGSVWIGTLKGLARYTPGQPREPASPPAVITAVRFGGHAANPAAFATVSYRDRDFAVSFSGLSFLSEKNVLFRYRLEGLDTGWVDSALREARYAGLPPGSYTFAVLARNAAGAWSPLPATMAFRIVPPWWLTFWFRALALGGLAALLALLARVYLARFRRRQGRLEAAVRERTAELELQKSVVERQKHEIEALLRKTEEASRLKSEFLANVSHEIRTPMNGVIGMTQLVLHTDLDSEQRDYIQTVQDSAEALLVVINDILDFSKIEAGKMEFAREPFRLRKCVADALAVFDWKAQAKGLKLVLEVSPEVPEMVVGDSDRLRQILLNLVGNAMKFTEQGEILLAVSMSAPGPTLRFSVRDTGVGIPYEKQAVIFEAFAQADGSASRRQGGTGLGLAICSKLVHLMNGRIWVESAPGAGSTFSFVLPLAPAGPAALVTGDPLPSRLPEGTAAPLRILLAEDHAVNQKLARRALERMGHSLVTVENGRKAVEAAARERFDVILMDLQMPEMDGLEATARIRGSERQAAAGGVSQHVPIVAMTAHAMSGDREACLRAGMDDYISKPIDLRALADLIHRVQVSEVPR